MEPRGKAIVLIGFMGSGKSSAGREVARLLRIPRFDTDEILKEKFGRPIAEIFAHDGEEKFRDAETEVLRNFSSKNFCVLVTGGGILLRPENRALVRSLGLVIQLTADEETLFRRISRRNTRPLLQTENPRATLSALLQARENLYAAAADHVLETSRLTHAEVAQAIRELIEK